MPSLIDPDIDWMNISAAAMDGNTAALPPHLAHEALELLKSPDHGGYTGSKTALKNLQLALAKLARLPDNRPWWQKLTEL